MLPKAVFNALVHKMQLNLSDQTFVVQEMQLRSMPVIIFNENALPAASVSKVLHEIQTIRTQLDAVFRASWL